MQAIVCISMDWKENGCTWHKPHPTLITIYNHLRPLWGRSSFQVSLADHPEMTLKESWCHYQVRHEGLAITNPTVSAEGEHQTSLQMTAGLMSAIKDTTMSYHANTSSRAQIIAHHDNRSWGCTTTTSKTTALCFTASQWDECFQLAHCST